MSVVPQAPWPGQGMETEHLENAPPPRAEESQALEGVWGHLAEGERSGRRDLLLPALRALQDARGWISYPAMAVVCRVLAVPLADAYGVAEFYHMLSTRPSPRRTLHLCDDVACALRGAGELAARLEKVLGPAGSHGEDDPLGWEPAPCLGQCDRAPAALVGEEELLHLIPEQLDAKLTALQAADAEQTTPQPALTKTLGPGTPMLLQRCGKVDPLRLQDYLDAGGFAGLRRALEIGPDETLKEVERSRVAGRGGAAFPAFRKWTFMAGAEHPRYLVCNADESEPTTFKDRVLMEEDPFAVLEGMAVAAYAVGAVKGWIYLRGEYTAAYAMLEEALRQARAAGYLGDGMLGSDFSFDIEIRRGAGAYVCGEETALLNSIEGLRGEPRPRPPFPAQVGLFGRPTLIQNVETLVCLPPILEQGGDHYASLGTEQSTGTKLVPVSGCVMHPGLYEVTFGIPLRSIIQAAGGTPEGRPIQAVLCGGAAGTFLGPDELDVPLGFETIRDIGGALGSGALFVVDDTVDLWQVADRITRFFSEESCGQCVPCRVGARRQWELVRHWRHNGREPDAQGGAMLDELVQVMQDASICGLGQLAPNALQSLLRLQRNGKG